MKFTRNTKRQIKKIKKNAKRAKKAVQNVGKVIGKILSSPVGKYQWLHGEVVNFTLEEVLAGYSFNDEEMVLFAAYQDQINKMIGGTE